MSHAGRTFSSSHTVLSRRGIASITAPIFGSLPDGTVVSPNSARCHRARTGETSRRHLLSERLPRTEVVMGSPFVHEPVMLAEILEVFAGLTSGTFVDCTLGGTGHSSAILSAHDHISLLGIDRDQFALSIATQRLAKWSERVTLRHARFDSLTDISDEIGITSFAGVLFDLGVSSPQFDEAERGFSYRHDAPLDMRMDTTQSLTAASVVNEYDIKRLENVIRDYSDERFAYRIARALVAARPVLTTVQLAEVVTAAIPAAARRRGGHPAKRTFQALRIEVNQELEILEAAMNAAIARLAPHARLAVLTYHSGEDRIVKGAMRAAETGGCTCPPRLPCACGKPRLVRRVRVPKTPSNAELERNPRSASARLRVVERVGE